MKIVVRPRIFTHVPETPRLGCSRPRSSWATTAASSSTASASWCRPAAPPSPWGPNGCGKSTLLRGLGRLLRPRSGSVVLDGDEIGSLPAREVARRLGLLPQSPIVPEGVSVLELAERGRHPHLGLLRTWSPADEAAVAAGTRRRTPGGWAGRLCLGLR